MARVVYTPDQHSCYEELALLGAQPIGTVAECSCIKRWVMRSDYRGERYWVEEFSRGDEIR